MRKNLRLLTQGAVLAALYVALTHLQNVLIPGSATWVIQFRASEALCVLALFTPAAVPGLTVGCLLFNLSFAGALPLDWLAGSLATLLAAGSMRLLKRLPLLALSMPAWFNALLVGWELTVFLGDTGFTLAAFWLNAVYVAIGELAVLYTLGWLLCRSLNRGKLAQRIFGGA